jgi:hypothetical protein
VLTPDAKPSSPRAQLSILAAGLLVLAAILALPPHTGKRIFNWLDTLRVASSILKATPQRVDIATDFVGARALLNRTDPYPILAPSLRDLGLSWDEAEHRSTHPPTCYLLVAPIAKLPVHIALCIWAWLMLGAIALSLRLLGIPTLAAIGLAPITLLWPPAATSLGQFTALWLLGFALAHSKRDSLAALGIALASFTKLIPALLLAPFFFQRRWRTIFLFTLFWLFALGVIHLLNPTTLTRYLEAGSQASQGQLLRPDNCAPIGQIMRFAGYPGALAFLTLLAVIWLRNRPWSPWVSRHSVAGSEPSALGTQHSALALHNALAIAILPIAWIYSALPLLPIYLHFIAKGSRAQSIACIIAMLLLTFTHISGNTAPACIAPALFIPALCFLLPTASSASVPRPADPSPSPP